jgi:hypothetical protein
MTDVNGSQDAVVIERTFDAPVDLIWQMWTDPEHFAAWYGPEGASIPVAKMDVRVGGTRLICMEMKTPEGTVQMWFTGDGKSRSTSWPPTWPSSPAPRGYLHFPQVDAEPVGIGAVQPRRMASNRQTIVTAAAGSAIVPAFRPSS